MADLVNLWSESNRDITSDDDTPTLTLRNLGGGAGLRASSSSNTIAAIQAVVSGATGSAFGILGGIDRGVVSTNSTASLAYAIRVRINDGTNLFYYIPVYTGAAGSPSGV